MGRTNTVSIRGADPVLYARECIRNMPQLMVTANTARSLALALPDVTEKDHHGFPSFRANGRIFATSPDADHMHIMLTEDDIRRAVEAKPQACEEQWWGKKLTAVRASLADLDKEELKALLTDAWSRFGPS